MIKEVKTFGDDGSDGRAVRSSSLTANALFIAIRGVLLWLLIPAVVIVWMTAARRFTSRGATLGKTLGWADLNLCAFIQRVLLRPVFARPQAGWVPASAIAAVSHRVRFIDPA